MTVRTNAESPQKMEPRYRTNAESHRRRPEEAERHVVRYHSGAERREWKPTVWRMRRKTTAKSYTNW